MVHFPLANDHIKSCFTKLSSCFHHNWIILHEICIRIFQIYLCQIKSKHPEVIKTIQKVCSQRNPVHQSCISAAAIKAEFWLLSEQSDREANECWLNRWVVTLLHWRGFTGDMMHCFTKVVGWQWAHAVGCLCVKCQSVSISKSRGVADMCSPKNLNWCLHNSSTAMALFHWHFMTSQIFSSAHPMFPLGQWMLYF